MPNRSTYKQCKTVQNGSAAHGHKVPCKPITGNAYITMFFYLIKVRMSGYMNTRMWNSWMLEIMARNLMENLYSGLERKVLYLIYLTCLYDTSTFYKWHKGFYNRFFFSRLLFLVLVLFLFTLNIVSLTSHVHLAIMMKLKLFSMAGVCPGNNHGEIGFIHLAF